MPTPYVSPKDPNGKHSHRGTESILSSGVIDIRKGMFPVNQIEILVDAELVIRFPGWHVASDFLNLPKSKDLPPGLDLSRKLRLLVRL